MTTYGHLLWTYVALTCLPLFAGLLVYGLGVIRVVGLAVAASVLTQRAVNHIMGSRERLDVLHSGLIGALVGLTLPATVPWPVPVVAAMIAVGLGKAAFGGIGHYFWHPAVVGRVAVQFLFPASLRPDRWASPFCWPFLARGHLFWGDLGRTCPAEHFLGWRDSLPQAGCEAWLAPRPERILRWLAQGRADLFGSDEHPLLVAVRDVLPPWEDTLLGLTGGGIGEGCAIALLVAAIYLIYRGYLRWQLVAGVLAGAALAAGLLPLPVGSPVSGASRWVWIPGLVCPDGLPVGPIYVLYHLTGGELMLVACLLAGETVSSPITPRGQVIFAVGLGALIVFLRLYGVMPCSGYWALLGLNSLVPWIDRHTRPRVLGT